MLQEFSEALVCLAGPINVGQTLEAILAQIAKRHYLAIGVEMPLEGGAETSPHDSYLDLFLRRARPDGSGGVGRQWRSFQTSRRREGDRRSSNSFKKLPASQRAFPVLGHS